MVHFWCRVRDDQYNPVSWHNRHTSKMTTMIMTMMTTPGNLCLYTREDHPSIVILFVVALGSRTTKNSDINTGSLTHTFTHLFVLLTHSLCAAQFARGYCCLLFVMFMGQWTILLLDAFRYWRIRLFWTIERCSFLLALPVPHWPPPPPPPPPRHGTVVQNRKQHSHLIMHRSGARMWVSEWTG